MLPLLSFVLLFFGFNQATQEPQITTPNGVIGGFYDKTWSDIEYEAYEGVPYALPPVGKHRFKDPMPMKPWKGVWPATNYILCMQYSHAMMETGNEMVIGDEDCLYVNVYKPKGNISKPLDVFVFIHGGAFMFGGGGYFGPKILLNKDSILITINYRLGPLGFLSTEDSVLPGNLGMKDQAMALKWIKDNVEHFGGNPSSITVTGLSAGGASVHLHLISPLSRGLMSRAISQSGHALDCWVLAEKSMEKTKLLAEHLGCPTLGSKVMVECLRNRPARKLVDAVQILQPWLYNPYSPLGVVIDKDSENPFLPEHPYHLLKKGKVEDIPWLLSHTSSEGLYPAADFTMKPNYLPDLEKNWNQYVPYILHYEHTIEPENLDKVSQKIKQHYLKDKPASNETFKEIVQLVSDRLFVTDSEIAARMHASVTKSPVYYYRFDYQGTRSATEIFTHNRNIYGVCHGDDTLKLVSSRIYTWTTKTDKDVSDILVNIWFSFAKDGVPAVKNVDWKPISKNKKEMLNYLDIVSPTDITLKSEMHFANHEFWQSIPFDELGQLLRKKKEEL